MPKKKTFREQLAVVISKRYPRENIDRYLDESSTPAAETVINYIRQWPSQYSSKNKAVCRLIECQRLNDKGEFVLEKNFKGHPYPFDQSLKFAWNAFWFGDLQLNVWPMYNFASSIKHIPDNIPADVAELIKDLFLHINKTPLKEAKLIRLGKDVAQYGANNPHTIVNWERVMSEFEKAQKAIDEFVVNRQGWEYLTTENLQNPKHAEEMSKVLCDILAKADEAIEPAFKACADRDRYHHVRQDATRARNYVKHLAEFFQTYEQMDVSSLESIKELIDASETRILGQLSKPLK